MNTHHTKARALIITAPGINCDLELVQAFETAGAQAERVLLSTLLRTPTLIDQYNLIGLPGGFSYGDDVAAGRIMAQLIRTGLYPALAAAIERGVPMIAPCNGFQIAVQAGLLPGPSGGDAWPSTPAAPVVSLLPNERGRFRDCWTRVEVPTNTTSVWTRGLACDGPMAALPSAHGEGRFVASTKVLDELEASGRVALRYAPDENFNGSSRGIAGICDGSGLVFGLMPHPERFTRLTQHPTWTRFDASERPSETLGAAMFRRAVEHVLVC
jgi:phosphoribosylformylglycinamidine synthase I